MSVDIAVFRRLAGTLRSAGALTVVGSSRAAASGAAVGAQGIPVTAPDSSLVVRIDTLIDLPTAISRALDVSPLIAASEGSVRSAQSEQRVATGAYVPTLAATSSLLRSNVTTTPVGDAAQQLFGWARFFDRRVHRRSPRGRSRSGDAPTCAPPKWWTSRSALR